MKRILCLLLAAVLVSGLAAVTASAQDTTVYKMSYNSDEPFQITAADKHLLFEGFPKTADFNYVMVRMTNASSKPYNQQYAHTAASGSFKYDISGVANGTYYVELYTSEVEYGTYWSYIFGKKLKISIKNGAATFVMSPVYERNVEIRSSKRTDSAALEYYLMPTRDIQSDDEKIIALAKSITRGAASDYQKVLAIHDWVCENIWYDYDVLNGIADYGDGSALSTLETKRSVCQGYAALTAALLRASGIPAKLVSGYALGISSTGEWTNAILKSDDSNHAWNEAFVDGRWIIMDVTWDSGNEYRNGVFSTDTGMKYRMYFDITIEAFSNDHRYEDYSEDYLPATRPVPTKQKVFVNGEEIAFEAYNISGSNYFKLRDLAYVLNGTNKQFEVGYTSKGAVIITGGKPYTPVGGEMTKTVENPPAPGTPAPGSSAFYLDGKQVAITAYNIGGNNFLKLREVMELLDIYVGYDGTVIIDTAKGYEN